MYKVYTLPPQVTVNECTPRNPPALSLAQHVSFFYLLNPLILHLYLKLHQIAHLPMLTLAQQSTCKSQNPGASTVSSFCNVESELMEGFFSHCTRIARLYMYLKLHNYELLQMHSEILSLLINCPPCELDTCGRVSHCER